MKMELAASSETSAISTQTPGNYPKRNKLHLEHGESLKTGFIIVFYINRVLWQHVVLCKIASLGMRPAMM